VTKVLFVAPFGALGGSEMFLARVAQGLSESVEARALLLGPGPLEGRLADAGVPVDVEPMLGKGGLLRFPRAARAWARRLEGEGIEVIHANQAKAALFAIPLARRLGVPVLWMKHDHFFDGRLSRWLARRCDRVVVVSTAMAAQFTGDLSRRVSVVYPGVRIPGEAAQEPTGQVISMAGRLDPLKDFGAVIRATRLLRDRGFEAEVDLAGTVDRVRTEHAGELDALVAELGLGDHVRIAATDDMDAHYRRARVFVLPSPPKPGGLPSEGAPTVLMEAMAHGTAVAAARQPGTEEVMGDVGVLLDDLSPEGWADALEPFLADSAMAARVGQEGRERAVERFSMTHTVAQLEALYGQLGARAS
jgi:glycosyltransferase involved in cell wall biosynthesis